MIRALEALTALLLKVHSHSAVPQDCAWQLSDLVGRGGSKEYREKLVKALESLEPFFPGLQKVVDLLRRLNAFSGKTAEEPDYDSRLDAYGECTASFFKGKLRFRFRCVIRSRFQGFKVTSLKNAMSG